MAEPERKRRARRSRACSVTVRPTAALGGAGPLVLIAALVFLTGRQATAAAVAQPFTLAVTPARIIVPYTPGQTVSRTIEAANADSTPFHVDVSLAEFDQRPDGSIRFAGPSADSGASWVVVAPLHFDIPAGGAQTVGISLTVPPDSTATERQIGVILRVSPGAGRGNVMVSGAIGVEVLAGTPHSVNARTELLGLRAPGFSSEGPITMTVTVSNRGNVHREFVTPHKLVADVSGARVSFPDFIVLRGVTRTVATSWERPPLMCVCLATVSVDDGQGHRLSSSRTIVIFPIRAALVVLASALGLVMAWRSRTTLRARRRANPAGPGAPPG
jgi:hypothetical protein